MLSVTSGSIANAFRRPLGAARLAITSGSFSVPRSAFSMASAMRAARRSSSSSRSNSREIAMVSSARASVVVKICASTILAPPMAQAPAMIDSSQGWSGANTVSSVTPRAASRSTAVASDFSAASDARTKRACASLCGRSTLSQ